jgi:hypothetical protein
MRKSMLCPCKSCRPRGETLKQAFKRIKAAVEIQRYGVEGANARQSARREKLDEFLKQRKEILQA